MSIVNNEQLTPREHLLMEAERDEARLAREHAIAMKKLELEVKRLDNYAKIELKQLESQWAAWLKLPSMLLMLPFYVLLGVAYCIATARKYEPSKRFFDLLQ
jgi:hypothetical protein